jgi:hypothetical protein
MISKSKTWRNCLYGRNRPCVPASAQYGATGGGSPGYNAHNTTNYRLKRHHHHGVKGRVSMKPHSWVKLKEKKSPQ